MPRRGTRRTDWTETDRRDVGGTSGRAGGTPWDPRSDDPDPTIVRRARANPRMAEPGPARTVYGTEAMTVEVCQHGQKLDRSAVTVVRPARWRRGPKRTRSCGSSGKVSRLTSLVLEMAARAGPGLLRGAAASVPMGR